MKKNAVININVAFSILKSRTNGFTILVVYKRDVNVTGSSENTSGKSKFTWGLLARTACLRLRASGDDVLLILYIAAVA